MTGNLTVTGADERRLRLDRAEPDRANPSHLVHQRRAPGRRWPTASRSQLAGGRLSRVSTSGRAGSTTHVLFDVTGYYRAGRVGGTTWYGHGPTRLLDTRTRQRPGRRLHQPRRPLGPDRPVGAACPSSAIAVTGNVTVTGATGSGYLSIGPSMSALADDLDAQLRGRPDAGQQRHAASSASGGRVVGRDRRVAPGCAPTSCSTSPATTLTGDGGARWYAGASAVGSLDTRIGHGLDGRFADGVPRGFQVDRRARPVRRRGRHRQPDRDRRPTGSGYVLGRPDHRRPVRRPRRSTSRPARRWPTASPCASTSGGRAAVGLPGPERLEHRT